MYADPGEGFQGGCRIEAAFRWFRVVSAVASFSVLDILILISVILLRSLRPGADISAVLGEAASHGVGRLK